MQSWVNQYSFALSASAAMLFLAAVLFRDGVKPGDFLALGALALGLALAYGLLRPGRGTALAAADVRAQIGNGTPVLLEFQSPY